MTILALLAPMSVLPEPDFSTPPKGYVCYRAESAPVIDGRLDDPAWQVVPWTDDFVDIEGDRKPRPQFRTRVKMMWDDDFFYIGAEMEEPHVWATLTEHDSVIFHDNDFEVFIDPNGNNHLYYEFEINALNTTWDLLLVRPYKNGGPPINAWEIPGMRHAVHVDGTLNDPSDTDRGWSVELAFPWAVLKECAFRPTPPRDGDQWRVNFSRVQWDVTIENDRYVKVPNRPEDNWVWSPQGVIDMHRPERWGYVQFSTRAPGTDAFRRDPAGAVRDWLHRVYYAQRRFHAQNGKWAGTLAELDAPPPPQAVTEPRLIVGEAQYELVAPSRWSERSESWHINHEARVWSRPWP